MTRKMKLLAMVVFGVIIAASFCGCVNTAADGGNMPNNGIQDNNIPNNEIQDNGTPDVPVPDWEILIIIGISDGSATSWNYLMGEAEPYIEDEIMMIPFEAFADAFGYGETDGVQDLVIKNGASFISLQDVTEKFGLNVDWWYSDFHEANLVWISDRTLLEKIEFQPDDNYELVIEEDDYYRVYDYVLKAEGKTYRSIMLQDTYDKVIESYGLPTRINRSSDDSIIKAIVYDFRVFPDSNTDEYLYFGFKDGVLDNMSVVIIEEF